MLSVSGSLHRRFIAADSTVKQREGWADSVKRHRQTFKLLTKIQSEFELALAKHFSDLAHNRLSTVINWASYMEHLVRAQDFVVNLDDYGFQDEQELLLAILQDYILQGIGVGVDAAQALYVDAGLSTTSAAIQKAARERSAQLVTSITGSTRDMIQESISTSLRLGEDTEAATARLMELLDDSYRSEMIARTETRNSYVDGTGQVADETGATAKAWDPSSAPCELCVENVDAGEIAIDDDFPNGDDPHPNCLCGVLYVYGDASGDGSGA